MFVQFLFKLRVKTTTKNLKTDKPSNEDSNLTTLNIWRSIHQTEAGNIWLFHRTMSTTYSRATRQCIVCQVWSCIARFISTEPLDILK